MITALFGIRHIEPPPNPPPTPLQQALLDRIAEVGGRENDRRLLHHAVDVLKARPVDYIDAIKGLLSTGRVAGGTEPDDAGPGGRMAYYRLVG